MPRNSFQRGQVLPERLVERISAYRRSLAHTLREGQDRVYSHDLARTSGATPAQVRRDLMTIGYSGSPARGYDVPGLIEKIGELLDPPASEGRALVGVGYLGSAILSYFGRMRPAHAIDVAFDTDPAKVGRVIHGCRCHAVDEIEAVLNATPASVGIVAVPAEGAQGVTDRLIRAGVIGLLNFAPVRLQVPPEVYVVDMDITVFLEKVAFIARTRISQREAHA